MDINTKLVKKTAFRMSKERNITACRVRVPGGAIDAKLLSHVQEIAETYGNGQVHLTTRQGFEILGIKFEDMDRVKEMLQPLIDGLEVNQPVKKQGYSAAGTRNIASCIGNKICLYANYNTTEFAKRIEKEVFPHDLHFKIALTGCPNDCIKARMHDFGIIGMTLPQYEGNRCVTCQACVKVCKKKSVEALKVENQRIVRDEKRCIGCGECIINCPTRAFTRSERKFYRLSLMGRTGKRNPRLGEDFIAWVTEEAILQIIKNTYDYVTEYIDRSAPGGKEHIGYIIDRTGFEEYKKWALKDVVMNEEAIVNQVVYWSGIHYD